MRTLPIICLILASCTGEQGPVGPDGADGIDGLDGAVNVTSRTVTLLASHFASAGESTESAVYDVEEITEDVRDNGVVIAFISLLGPSSGWFALPMTIPVQGNVVSVGFFYQPGLFELIIQHQGSASLASVFQGSIVRIIVIPPGESLSKADLNRMLD